MQRRTLRASSSMAAHSPPQSSSSEDRAARRKRPATDVVRGECKVAGEQAGGPHSRLRRVQAARIVRKQVPDRHDGAARRFLWPMMDKAMKAARQALVVMGAPATTTVRMLWAISLPARWGEVPSTPSLEAGHIDVMARPLKVTEAV